MAFSFGATPAAGAAPAGLASGDAAPAPTPTPTPTQLFPGEVVLQREEEVDLFEFLPSGHTLVGGVCAVLSRLPTSPSTGNLVHRITAWRSAHGGGGGGGVARLVLNLACAPSMSVRIIGQQVDLAGWDDPSGSDLRERRVALRCSSEATAVSLAADIEAAKRTSEPAFLAMISGSDAEPVASRSRSPPPPPSTQQEREAAAAEPMDQQEREAPDPERPRHSCGHEYCNKEL